MATSIYMQHARKGRIRPGLHRLQLDRAFFRPPAHALDWLTGLRSFLLLYCLFRVLPGPSGHARFACRCHRQFRKKKRPFPANGRSMPDTQKKGLCKTQTRTFGGAEGQN